MAYVMRKNERLITFVSKHPELYNGEHGSLELKNRLWREVARSLNISSVYEVKKTWKNLRDTYRLTLKNHAKKSTWKYYDQMAFLLPYLKKRPRRSSANFSDNENDQLIQTNKPEEQGMRISESPRCQEANKIEYSRQDFAFASKKPSDDEVDKNCSFKGNVQVDGDSLKIFFDAMHAVTKEFPKPLQRRVKEKVFQIVNEAEEEAESQQNDDAACTFIKSEPE